MPNTLQGHQLYPEVRETLTVPPFDLVDGLQPLTDEYVNKVNLAGPQDPIGLQNMLWEVVRQTDPIFDSLLAAKGRGNDTAKLYMDRIAMQQQRLYDEHGEEIIMGKLIAGHVATFGVHRAALQAAADHRKETFLRLDEAGITDPIQRTRGHYPLLSHDHTKVGFVGDTAWLMTNNFRGLDYVLSNFALRTTNPAAVEFIKEKFYMTGRAQIDPNDIRDIDWDEQGRPKTTMLFDGGKRGSSVSMDSALDLVESMQPGDKFTFVSQWPPIGKVMGIPFFGTMDAALRKKMAEGVKGTYLVNPADKLVPSPNARIQRGIKKHLDNREAEEPNLDIVYLPRGTHAKALFVERANGDSEVICGTHDFAEWTSKVGTRAMSVRTRDQAITSQLGGFLKRIQEEKV